MGWDERRRDALALVSTLNTGDDFGVFALTSRDVSGGELVVVGTARPVVKMAAIVDMLAEEADALTAAGRVHGFKGEELPAALLAVGMTEARAALLRALARAGVSPK